MTSTWVLVPFLKEKLSPLKEIDYLKQRPSPPVKEEGVVSAYNPAVPILIVRQKSTLKSKLSFSHTCLLYHCIVLWDFAWTALWWPKQLNIQPDIKNNTIGYNNIKQMATLWVTSYSPNHVDKEVKLKGTMLGIFIIWKGFTSPAKSLSRPMFLWLHLGRLLSLGKRNVRGALVGSEAKCSPTKQWTFLFHLLFPLLIKSLKVFLSHCELVCVQFGTMWS